MTIIFFISDHGFGHMMRELPVIKFLLENGNSIVAICGSKCCELAKEYLESESVTGNIEFIECHTDTGITVIPGTIRIDKKETAKNVQMMLSEYPEREKIAADIIKRYNADKVVADIVPWALRASKKCGVHSYLMASFLWLDQYGFCIPEENRMVFRESFKMADDILYYDICNKPTHELLGDGREVGFVSRNFHNEIVKEIRNMHDKKIVFLSLGGSNTGLDFPIYVGDLNYDFISTGALNLIGDNVEYLDVDTNNTQDYIKAADFCISKPGWTTVSEIMVAGTKTALLKRPDDTEDTMTTAEMVKRGCAVAIDVEDLHCMGKVMEKMENYSWRNCEHKNNYEGIANIITE